MLATVTLRSPSTTLIKQTLLSSGPCTTQVLHSLLHQSSSTPLPPRPQSSSFLSSSSSRRSSSPASPPPPQQPEGTWSKSYLKHRLLAPMAQRGEVIKITRGKYLNASGLSSTSSGPKDAAAASGGQKELQKHEEEHVWVLGEEWARLLGQSRARREAEREQRRQQREMKVPGETEKEWGVRM